MCWGATSNGLKIDFESLIPEKFWRMGVVLTTEVEILALGETNLNWLKKYWEYRVEKAQKRLSAAKLFGERAEHVVELQDCRDRVGALDVLLTKTTEKVPLIFQRPTYKVGDMVTVFVSERSLINQTIYAKCDWEKFAKSTVDSVEDETMKSAQRHLLQRVWITPFNVAPKADWIPEWDFYGATADGRPRDLVTAPSVVLLRTTSFEYFKTRPQLFRVYLQAQSLYESTEVLEKDLIDRMVEAAGK